jgi:hypothetical protein
MRGKLIPFFRKQYQFPARNTKWLKNGKRRRAILSAFYNISQRNFGILLILWCSCKLWWIFCLDLFRSKFCSLGNRSIENFRNSYSLQKHRIEQWWLKPGFHVAVTVVKIDSRSFSSAEIQHLRTENTRTDYNYKNTRTDYNYKKFCKTKRTE